MLANELLWVLLGLGLIAYVLTGGAGFGGGLLHLLASGPRKAEQRKLIEAQLARFLEVNHVWLLSTLVLLLGAFPLALRAIHDAVTLPLTVAMVGIVLRGATIAFGSTSEGSRRHAWFVLVEWMSALTPIALGLSLAGLATGSVYASSGQPVLPGWITSFGWLVGFMALALFALLAAVYLAVESEAPLTYEFRRRALIAEIFTVMLGVGALRRAAIDAPVLYAKLADSWWTLPVQILAAAAVIATVFFLWRGQLGWARAGACAQAVLVVLGWGLAMDRHFLLPGPSVESLALPEVIALGLLPTMLLVTTILFIALPWLRTLTATRLPDEPRVGHAAPDVDETPGPA